MFCQEEEEKISMTPQTSLFMFLARSPNSISSLNIKSQNNIQNMKIIHLFLIKACRHGCMQGINQ